MLKYFYAYDRRYLTATINQKRSRFRKRFRLYKTKAPVPVNELASMASLGSGTGVLFSRPPDDDTDPRLKPGALIDEVKPLVSGCGKIGFRSL